MAKQTRAERRREFLAAVAINTRRLNCKSGVASVEADIKKEWPNLPDKLPGQPTHYERHEPLPKFDRVVEPEAIFKLNQMNEKI